MISVRIRFTRGEEVKFVSHLDLMKVFERATRRSGLPIAYSQGFNPHPQMVFGLPLAVGMTSDGEYADFDLAREIEPDEFMSRLNESLPEAIRVTAAGRKKTKTNIMASIGGADYILEIYPSESLPLESAAEKLELLLKKESIKVLKESKGRDGRSTMKEVEIRPLVLETQLEALSQVPAGYEEFNSAFVIKARFRAGNTANLRPELFIKALVEQAGIPSVVNRMHRKALYVEMNGMMVDPLDQAVL